MATDPSADLDDLLGGVDGSVVDVERGRQSPFVKRGAESFDVTHFFNVIVFSVFTSQRFRPFSQPAILRRSRSYGGQVVKRRVPIAPLVSSCPP